MSAGLERTVFSDLEKVRRRVLFRGERSSLGWWRIRESAEDEVKSDSEHGDVDENRNGADRSLDGGNGARFLF